MFRRIADKLGMLVTGGSDFHGEIKPKVEFGVFGQDVQIDLDELLKKMKKLTAERRGL